MIAAKVLFLVFARDFTRKSAPARFDALQDRHVHHLEGTCSLLKAGGCNTWTTALHCLSLARTAPAPYSAYLRRYAVRSLLHMLPGGKTWSQWRYRRHLGHIGE